MSPGAPRIAAAALVAMTMVGCQPAAPPSADAVPASVVVDVRSPSLVVPVGLDLQQVEFADASTGYAAFWSTAPVNLATTNDANEFRYASAVFATTDGGRTWQRLEDPRSPSNVPQLYTVDARTIALQSWPEGWYVSRDGGATFRFDAGTREPPEVARHLNRGAFRLDCEAICGIVGTGPPRQPGLPGDLAAVTEAAGVVWAASLAGAVAHTALSRDRGMTWQRRDVPDHPGGRPGRLTMLASSDGRDVWLVGYQTGGVGGIGSVVPARRKDVGVPLLWLSEGDRWVPKGTIDAPIPNTNPYSVAAVGGGLTAVAGPLAGLALVDAAWHTVELSPRAEFVTTLRDGTVFAATSRNRTFYLGTRSGSEIRWARITLGLTA